MAPGYRPHLHSENPTRTTPETIDEQSKPAAQSRQSRVPVDVSGLKSNYANVVGIMANVNEIYLTFGLNPDPYGQTASEPVKLDSRVVMTPDTAKRMCLNLNQAIAAYEQRFGVIELDLQKRLRTPAA